MSAPRTGVVRDARLSPAPPPFLRPRRKTGRKRQGITYEKKVHEHLGQSLGDGYVPSPWFTYWRGERVKPLWCQPDALYFDLRASRVTIVEVKYQHTADAYWQLMDLYLPVVEAWLSPAPGPWQIDLLEVVKWYDPHTPFPAEVTLCANPARPSMSAFNVHIWNPKRPAGGKGQSAAPSVQPSLKVLEHG